MKKAIVTVLAVAMVILLCSCGKSSNVDKAKSRTLDICDKYLNYEITKGETIVMLEDLCSRLSDSEMSEYYLKIDVEFLERLLLEERVDAKVVNETIEYIRINDYTSYSE